MQPLRLLGNITDANEGFARESILVEPVDQELKIHDIKSGRAVTVSGDCLIDGNLTVINGDISVDTTIKNISY
jgi:hypothetical protein